MIDKKDKPLIEFPAKFPIKIFGKNKGSDTSIFLEIAKNIVLLHIKEEKILDFRQNISKNGKYTAITILILAENQKQIDNIYQSLSDSDDVTMAL